MFIIKVRSSSPYINLVAIKFYTLSYLKTKTWTFGEKGFRHDLEKPYETFIWNNCERFKMIFLENPNKEISICSFECCDGCMAISYYTKQINKKEIFKNILNKSINIHL